MREDYMKSSIRDPPDHVILHVDTNDLSSKKCSMKIAKSSIILTCRLKNEIHGVSVSTIILRTDDKILNERGVQVNLHLKELSKENNIFLIDNSRKIKAQYLNKGKLHLTKYGSRVLSNNFVNEISKVFDCQIDRGNSKVNAGECNFEDDLTAKKHNVCNITLETIRSDNGKKLIFAHLKINPVRNKSEFLATQVKGKIDVLKISETKTDFLNGNFLIAGFSTPDRLDHDSKGGGGIKLYIKTNIPSNILLKINPSKAFFMTLTCQILKY